MLHMQLKTFLQTFTSTKAGESFFLWKDTMILIGYSNLNVTLIRMYTQFWHFSADSPLHSSVTGDLITSRFLIYPNNNIVKLKTCLNKYQFKILSKMSSEKIFNYKLFLIIDFEKIIFLSKKITFSKFFIF